MRAVIIAKASTKMQWLFDELEKLSLEEPEKMKRSRAGRKAYLTRMARLKNKFSL